MSATKRKGDLAEQLVATEGLRRGWAVLWPIGDRLPYDLVFDTGEKLQRVQVKAAWFSREYWWAEIRKAVTHERYDPVEVDFVITVLIDDLDAFHIIPTAEAAAMPRKIKFATERTAPYLGAWDLIGPERG